jgi:hypothetical protein
MSRKLEQNRASDGSSPTGAERRTNRDMERSEGMEDTHTLEGAERGTSEDTKRNRVSEEHSPTRERRREDMSGHGKRASGGHSLPGEHRGWDKSEQSKLFLASEGHSLPVEGGVRDKSKHGKKATPSCS